MNIREVQLERIKIGVESQLSGALLDEKVFTQATRWAVDHYGIAIQGFLWGRSVERFVVSYPRDWWEAVKERFAPAWFLRHWPVRYTRKTIELKAIYPDLRMTVPDRKLRLVVLDGGVFAAGYHAEGEPIQ